MNVNCKGLYPTKDFNQNIELIQEKNVLQIKPVVLLNSNYSLSKPEFVFTKLQFNLLERGFNTFDTVNILPLSIEIKDSSDVSFLNTPSFSTELDDIYKSYLDCLTIKTLFSKPGIDTYMIKKSGYEFIFTKEQLIKSCVDDLRFSFIVDFENYDLKKNEFRTYLTNTLDIALKEQKDYSTKTMNLYFEEILDEYSNYLLSINKYKNEENVLKLSLDPDYLFEHLLKITKNMSNNDKMIILESASSTILKNKEDVISIRRKDNVNSILNFFDSDIKNINDNEIKVLYNNIEEIILKNYFKTNSIANVCDVNFVLTPKSISLNNFSFDFTNTLKYCLTNSEILLDSNDNKIFITTSDYNYNTSLTLDFKDKIYVSGKEINLLDSKIVQKKDYKEISLIYDVVPIYVLTKERSGKLLGIINITEIITEKYNASNSSLYNTEKPWWDFLVIYR